ncbi:MAG: PKD domain-containing protein [Flavisolibacter sp.]
MKKGFFCFTILFFVGVTAQAQLVADFYISKQGGCSPLTVSFTNTTFGASAAALYHWDFGNGNTSALANPGAIYTDEKIYTVTLTVTDGTKTSSKSTTVTVYKKPTADFSIPAAKVCLPAAASFTSTSTAGDGSIMNYFWDYGDGITQQGYGSSISHYYTAEQKPTVSLTVTNSYGCTNSTTKTNAIEILGSMNPAFTADKTVLCFLSDAVQFTNTSTGPGTLLYKWNFGDGTTSDQKNPSHNFTKKAVYPVTVTVSNTDGCTATSYPVSVNAAYFNTDFSYRPLCRELSFNGTSYLYPSSSLWKFGDGSSLNSYSSTTHIYNNAGTYNVSLINTYDACKDTVSKTVVVKDLVNFNSAVEAPGLLCKEGYYTFKSKSDVEPGNSFWEFGDGSNGYWKEVGHGYTAAGTYAIKLTNTFGTCKETVTKEITVNDLPDPKGFITDYGGVCGSPVTVQFKDTTPGTVKWEWRTDYSYNNVFSSQRNTSYNFSYDGNYNIWLTVFNAAGCSRTVYKTVSVYKPSVSINLVSSSSLRGYYDCDSLKIKLSTYSNQPLTAYLWNFGDGSTSTEASPEHLYNTVGGYNITLNYITESGCKGVATYYARVYAKPKADFTYSFPCDNSLNLQFRDASFFSDGWEWNFGDNNFNGYGSYPEHVYADTGKYNVTFINHIGHCADTVVKTVYANVLPSAVNITKAENTCDGTRGTVTFDQRSLRINSGTWDFGDGTVIPYDTSQHIVKHTYKKTGTYTVVLRGTSANCALASSVIVSVLLKQNPLLTANKTELCSNDYLNVQISNLETNPFNNSRWGQYYLEKYEYNNGAPFTGGISNYQWDYTNYTSTLNNFSAGVTKMRAIINRNGCSDTTNYINLKVNGPVAGFKVLNNEGCYKSAIIFQDTSKTVTNTPLVRWQWDFGDGATATLTSSVKVEHLYKDPGNYNVRLVVTDASGCSSSFSYFVSAKGPKAAFYASGLYVPNVPLNTTVTFYNNTVSWYSNSVDYTWQYGDGTTSSDYYGQHTYTKAGVNTVKLIAKDASISCADTALQTITVKDFNTAFSFYTNYIAAGSCPPAIVSITNLSVGYTKLVWDFGDGTIINDQYRPSHTYYNPGVYKITLYTYGNNGLTGTYKDSVIISQPGAQIKADVLHGCISQQVGLLAATINSNNYLWDFGDGTIKNGTATSSSHQYLTPGVYQPKLIVKDDKGCTSATTLPDKIVIDSLSVIMNEMPSPICDSAKIFFTPDIKSIAADAVQQPLVYHWDFGTGNAKDTANTRNAIFNFIKPGTYTVKLRVTSPFGCTKEVAQQITVYKKAKASINGSTELCAGSSTTFTGNASMSPSEWLWTFGNGNTGNVQRPAAQTFNDAGTYNIQLVVKYNGCYDTAVQQLIVHPNPVVNLSASKNIVCLGESVQLNATGGKNYIWKPTRGLSNAAIASPLANPVQSTMYSVEVANEFGCKKMDSIQLTVVQPLRLITVQDTFVCKDNSVQLNVQGANAYQWINNTSGLNNTKINNPVASPSFDIAYTVVGRDAYNCFRDTATIKVAVKPLPYVKAEQDVQMLAAESHQLTATASSDVAKWFWSPDLYLSCTNCPSPIAQPRTPIDYIVTVKNQYGCTAADTVSVKLACSENFVFIPNSFTPNNDGKNDLFYIKGKGISIIKSLLIYNRWGEIIFERKNFNIDDKAAAWDGKFKGLIVPPGSYVYFAEMQCEMGQPIIKKGTVTVLY